MFEKFFKIIFLLEELKLDNFIFVNYIKKDVLNWLKKINYLKLVRYGWCIYNVYIYNKFLVLSIINRIK